MVGVKTKQIIDMLPIKFKEFAKQPIVGTLFIVMGAIGALYVDIRSTFQDQAKSQDIRIEKLEHRVDVVSDALRKSDSLSAVSTTKLSTLAELGAIKGLK
jgi:hypothetical protein